MEGRKAEESASIYLVHLVAGLLQEINLFIYIYRVAYLNIGQPVLTFHSQKINFCRFKIVLQHS